MSVVIDSRVAHWSWEDAPYSWDETNTAWDTASRTLYTANVDEAVLLSGKIQCLVVKPLKESVLVTDRYAQKVSAKRVWQEDIAFTDEKQARYVAFYTESISAKEWFEKQMRYIKTYLEDVSFAETFSRKAMFAERVMREDIELEDSAQKKISVIKNESFPSVSDAIMENANAVIDMVSFYNGVMNEQTFLERANTVQGYSSFKEFYVGDYEYQKALVRLSVQAEQMNSGINLYNVVHYVDIPDTDDRGTVTITDTTATTKVYFNKFYYHAPEVSATLIGGNTGDGFMMPVVTNPNGQDENGRYFEMELRDMSGARKMGTVVWVSKGY